MSLPKCDKCNHPVHPSNDATLILAEMTNNPWYILSYSRHFLPTDKCEGSPSRSQYIKGQPRDTRGYPYIAELEKRWRDALKAMQKKYKIIEKKQ